MKSTGEAIRFIKDLKDPFLRKFIQKEICIYRAKKLFEWNDIIPQFFY